MTRRPTPQQAARRTTTAMIVHGDELTDLGLDVLVEHLERGESIAAILLSAWETKSPVLLALGRAILANPGGAGRLEAMHCPRRRSA